jgi:SOS response regulatory protein OraA/RecX
LGALDGVDASTQCAQVILKKYGSVPENTAERKKMIASLLRQGYGMDEIRTAMEMLLRGEE